MPPFLHDAAAGANNADDENYSNTLGFLRKQPS